MSDEALLEMNREYLNHDYYTDIITFDNSIREGRLEGDVFISWERVEDNGQTIGTGILEEYIRVIGHGVLHLLGFKDKSEIESNDMRHQENAFIDLYFSSTT